MAKLKPEFVEGCRASGTAPSVIEWLWTTNERSADYSFNKSPRRLLRADRLPHRVAEGQLPGRVHGRADLLGDGHQGQGAVLRRQRCEEMGIEILPPDVNESDHEFVVVDGNIRFGLDAVKGVGLRGRGGDQGARARRAARSRRCGTSASGWTPATVNKKAIEALIKCGAFGSTGATRKGMLIVLEQAQGAGQKAQQDAQIGQGSIFDLGGDGLGGGERNGGRARGRVRARAPADPGGGVRPRRAAGGREGGDRPVHLRPPAQGRSARRCARGSTARWPSWPAAATATGSRSAGSSSQAKRIRTKKGDPMMFATLDDLEGQVELLVFGNVLADGRGALAADAIVVVRGPGRPQGRRQDLPDRPGGRGVRADPRGARAAAESQTAKRARRPRARTARPRGRRRACPPP